MIYNALLLLLAAASSSMTVREGSFFARNPVEFAGARAREKRGRRKKRIRERRDRPRETFLSRCVFSSPAATAGFSSSSSSFFFFAFFSRPPVRFRYLASFTRFFTLPAAPCPLLFLPRACAVLFSPLPSSPSPPLLCRIV